MLEGCGTTGCSYATLDDVRRNAYNSNVNSQQNKQTVVQRNNTTRTVVIVANEPPQTFTTSDLRAQIVIRQVPTIINTEQYELSNDKFMANSEGTNYSQSVWRSKKPFISNYCNPDYIDTIDRHMTAYTGDNVITRFTTPLTLEWLTDGINNILRHRNTTMHIPYSNSDPEVKPTLFSFKPDITKELLKTTSLKFRARYLLGEQYQPREDGYTEAPSWWPKAVDANLVSPLENKFRVGLSNAISFDTIDNYAYDSYIGIKYIVKPNDGEYVYYNQLGVVVSTENGLPLSLDGTVFERNKFYYYRIVSWTLDGPVYQLTKYNTKEELDAASIAPAGTELVFKLNQAYTEGVDIDLITTDDEYTMYSNSSQEFTPMPTKTIFEGFRNDFQTPWPTVNPYQMYYGFEWVVYNAPGFPYGYTVGYATVTDTYASWDGSPQRVYVTEVSGEHWSSMVANRVIEESVVLQLMDTIDTDDGHPTRLIATKSATCHFEP